MEYDQTLREISRDLWGETMEMRVVDPSSLKQLKENARYFKREVFNQLVNNIRNDKKLSSVPLCWLNEDGDLEILSGNHRIQSAILAGIEKVLVLVILERLDKSRRISIQLSHNSLMEEDDISVLSNLWAKMEDIENRLYSGISSDTVKQIENIELVPMTTPQIYTRVITFAFTQSEAANLEEIMSSLNEIPQGTIYLSEMALFDKFFELLRTVKTKHEIKNASLAMSRILEIVSNQLEVAACPSSAQ